MNNQGVRENAWTGQSLVSRWGGGAKYSRLGTGEDRFTNLHDKGPDQIPIAAFSLWRLVKDALLSQKVKV